MGQNLFGGDIKNGLMYLLLLLLDLVFVVFDCGAMKQSLYMVMVLTTVYLQTK